MKKILVFILLSIFINVAAAPKPEPWPFWEKYDANSNITVSHKTWSELLTAYLSEQEGIARFDYRAVSDAHRQQLNDYIEMLTQTPVLMLSRDEQLAFWINLYNALTVKVVLDNYPVSSIKKISSGFLSTGPWDDELIIIADKELSLNDIEHRILRPIWKDPRLHYAVNCASIGCPNLATTAYTAQTMEDMLKNGAIAYINHPRGAKIDDDKLIVSSIYTWFIDDFGGDDAGVISHLKQYADETLRARLENISTISDDDYNWDLNDK